MTVLEADPLNVPVDKGSLRKLGTALIVGSLVVLASFVLALQYDADLPSTTLYGTEAYWYFPCLIPAVLPVTVFFSYWIWLSSQYFRSHRDSV